MRDVNAWFGMILARSDYLHAKRMIWEVGSLLHSLLLVGNNLDCAILHLDPYHRFWFHFATSVMMESSLCMVFFQSRCPFTKWVNPWRRHRQLLKKLDAPWWRLQRTLIWRMLRWIDKFDAVMIRNAFLDTRTLKGFEHARRIWTSWMSSMLHGFKSFRPNHQWTIDFSSSSIKLTTGCEKGASEAFSQEQCPKLESGLRYPNSDQILYILDSQWIHLGRCGCYQSLESHGSFVQWGPLRSHNGSSGSLLWSRGRKRNGQTTQLKIRTLPLSMGCWVMLRWCWLKIKVIKSGLKKCSFATMSASLRLSNSNFSPKKSTSRKNTEDSFLRRNPRPVAFIETC